ncbi:MAG: hypothetical protein D6746_16685 [Bacteroidetes bacterium]|nr:MAG: hypothetical protein D6746_16685 [Bacteroidota bacterium]
MTIFEMHHAFKSRINRFDANTFEDLTPDVIDYFLNTSMQLLMDDSRYKRAWEHHLTVRKEIVIDDQLTIPNVLPHPVRRFIRVTYERDGRSTRAIVTSSPTSSFFDTFWMRHDDETLTFSHRGKWTIDYVRNHKPLFVGGYDTPNRYFGLDTGYSATDPAVSLEVPDEEGMHNMIVEEAVRLFIETITLHR